MCLMKLAARTKKGKPESGKNNRSKYEERKWENNMLINIAGFVWEKKKERKSTRGDCLLNFRFSC